MSRTLVAYFSATGVTAGVAKTIASLTGADTFEIRPEKPYTEADLDWQDKTSRTTIEQKDKDCFPAIAGKVADMGEYGTIFLGFPVWWYGAPRIIFTFLGAYDFSGKIMLPFVTSGSSGLGDIPAQLKSACPAARWQAGKRFGAGAAKADIESWVKEHTGWKN